MEIKGPLSSQGIFSFTPVMVFTAAASPRLLKRLKEVYYTQLFWDFEIHVISQCQDLFRPPSPRRTVALGPMLA